MYPEIECNGSTGSWHSESTCYAQPTWNESKFLYNPPRLKITWNKKFNRAAKCTRDAEVSHKHGILGSLLEYIYINGSRISQRDIYRIASWINLDSVIAVLSGVQCIAWINSTSLSGCLSFTAPRSNNPFAMCTPRRRGPRDPSFREKESVCFLRVGVKPVQVAWPLTLARPCFPINEATLAWFTHFMPRLGDFFMKKKNEYFFLSVDDDDVSFT